MTVSSLWTVLDESNCGRQVGIEDFVALSNNGRGRSTTLAVDTSIWICEAMSSAALSSFHADPVLYLIYQRTTKLLKIGIGLVFVLEGNKRRVNSQELRKRRSGTEFDAATTRAESLLRLLGVPVIRAEAEAEALCALLSANHIVDGVVSNDSDCLLFGSRQIYTNFTLEHLENGTVIKYDADRLNATVDGKNRSIALSRKDLIAFALLCGSDMCNGVPNVGHKKAISFLDACKSLTQQPNEGTCLEKLLSWSDEMSNKAPIHNGMRSRSCTLCLHPGSKDLHARNGCSECRTVVGEGCFVVTPMEKIVISIQQKVAKMKRHQFTTSDVVDAYLSPNGNSIPSSLVSLTSKTCIATPDAAQLFHSSLILKGANLSSSQHFIRQTLPQLLARLDLLSTEPRNVYATISNQMYKPIPIRVEKILVRKSVPCYEVIWVIAVEEEKIQFSTYEYQCAINSAFPRLVETYHREERKRQRGLIEQERHRKFVGTSNSRHQSKQQREKKFNRNMKPGQRKKRERQFDAQHFRKQPMMSENQTQSNDVAMLLDHIPPMRTDMYDEVRNRIDSHGQNGNSNWMEKTRRYDEDAATEIFDLQQDDSIFSSGDEEIMSSYGNTNQPCANNFPERVSRSLPVSSMLMPSLSPNNERIFCNLGACQIECTPIIRRSNKT